MKTYKYRKITDAVTTYAVIEPDYKTVEGPRIAEIGLLDGFTYISVPDGLTLPPQPEQVVLIEADYNVDLINHQVVDKIRNRFSVNDEIKMLRAGTDAEKKAWGDYVEECRAWGTAKKSTL
jgi:hypothetical protein